MSESIHPSVDHLSAFYDQELDPPQRTQVEQHLTGCTGCRNLLAEFATLQELGPVIEQSLPAEAFWLDLPDRIAARIAAPDVPSRGEPSGWRERWAFLTHPQGVWRVALGSTLAVVVLGSAWMAFHEPENPVTPISADLNGAVPESQVGLFTPLPANEPTDDIANLSPESFTRRVITTLGRQGNFGQSLDIVPGQPVDATPTHDPLGTAVGLSLPPLGAETRAEVEELMGAGCGETSTIENAFLAALKAEEEGDDDLARQGYRLIRFKTNPKDPLHWEAHYRLLYNVWRQQLTAVPASRKAQALDRLQTQAAQSFQQWSRSGAFRDCQEAYCINRAVAKLVGEEVGQAPAPAATNMTTLANCGN